MQKFKWLLPLALFVPLLMAPSGGYPVNPLFASVGIGGSGACAPPNLFAVCAQSGQSAVIELAGPAEVAGTSSLAIGQNSANITQIADRKSGDNLLIQTTGTGQIQFTAAGGVLIGSAPVATYASTAMGITTGVSCSFSSSKNIASCTRSAAGAYTGTLSGFSTTPTCTASYQASGAAGASFAGTIDVVASSSTSVSINTYSSAGALSDAQHNCGGGGACIQIVCIGV